MFKELPCCHRAGIQLLPGGVWQASNTRSLQGSVHPCVWDSDGRLGSASDKRGTGATALKPRLSSDTQEHQAPSCPGGAGRRQGSGQTKQNLRKLTLLPKSYLQHQSWDEGKGIRLWEK